jgi:hypothetical protein
MADWVDFTGTGRGAGGWGFPNRCYTSDTVYGGGGSSSSRWRGDRSGGRPPTQPQYRYHPVDASHRHSSPSAGPEQPSASASTRHAQTYPVAAMDKSPVSGTVAPAGSNKEPDDKESRNAANFECNVCFDMAAEPVVTKCGHLFCWECLYQWLHVHSEHHECPVCKGQVAKDAVIPIYGRGGSAAKVHNAPPRPPGARVESLRQQQQRYPQMVYVDDDDDEEEDNPFDSPSMVNFGFRGTSLSDAMRSFMSPSFEDMDIEEQYDGYSYEYIPEDFDDVYDNNLMGFPMFAGTEANYPNSSQAHADLIDLTDRVVPPVHHRDGYSGVHSHNQGRCRYRARASANQSSTDAMVMGGSGASYCDNIANSNGSAGASSQPPYGWVERRGRSNRNLSSGGGRGMQDGRRQRSNYS